MYHDEKAQRPRSQSLFQGEAIARSKTEAPAQAAPFEVAVAPSRFEVTGKSASRVGQSLTVFNVGSSATEVAIRTLDWSYSPDGNVTYHDSCAGLREIGIKMQPRYLLQMAGASINEMADCEKCCGFGGTFSVKLGDISTRMAQNKCANIAASGAKAIVGGDLGCLLNIEGRLRRNGDRETRVLHFAEVIAGRE